MKSAVRRYLKYSRERATRALERERDADDLCLAELLLSSLSSRVLLAHFAFIELRYFSLTSVIRGSAFVLVKVFLTRT